MTPRELDWRAVGRKLRRCRELLDQLAAVGTVDRARLTGEPITALAVERILTLLVDLAFSVNSHVAVARLGRAPDSYAESFLLAGDIGLITPALAAALRPSAGLRNVLVHNYMDIDVERVVEAVPRALEQYARYVQQVAAFVQKGR